MTALGRCVCREEHTGHQGAVGCTRDAVRLVTVWEHSTSRLIEGQEIPGEPYTRQVPFCEPCAQHHECASHTERTTAKGGRE